MGCWTRLKPFVSLIRPGASRRLGTSRLRVVSVGDFLPPRVGVFRDESVSFILR